MSSRSALFAFVLLGLGCAEGASATATTEGTGGAGGDATSTSESTSEASSTASSASTSGPSTSTTTGAGGDGGMGGAGGAGGTGGAGGAGGGGPTCDFTAMETCENATLLPDIIGDDGSATAVRSGRRSQWFRVRITEDVGGILGNGMSVRFRLTSPASTSYALRVYEGNTDSPNCGASPQSGSGNPKEINRSWGDTLGSDDTRWFTVEVAHESGDACSASDEWTLEVRGNP